MRENFDFRAKTIPVNTTMPLSVQVLVRGTTIRLQGTSGRLASGVWVAGRYVRYPRSQELCIHPALLDEVDRQLRLRMTAQGLHLRSDPPRRSAVGYGD